MINERQQIALAALLHDIGKFWQRADVSMKDSEHVRKYENNFEWLVPTNKKTLKAGYQHAIWTYAFIIEHKAIFSKVIASDRDEDIEAFAILSAKHHKPDSKVPAQSIISLADKWASRNERNFVDMVPDDSTEDYEDKEGINWGKYAYKKVPMHSIFDMIHREGLTKDQRHYYDFNPLKVVGDHISIMPKRVADITNPKASREEDYNRLWQQFITDFDNIGHCKNFDQYFTYIQSLMLKYCWCIPSSTMDMPYSSLYEHSKITSGLATALWDYYKASELDFLLINKSNYGAQFNLAVDSGYPLLLCCIDMSGIQKYIYDIGSSQAAKALKGRSYSLQLMMRSVINEILKHEDVDLPPTNIVYASGGKAYLLLPNTAKCTHALNGLSKHLESKFFDEQGIGLYPAIGYVAFKYQVKFREEKDDPGYEMKMYSPDLDKPDRSEAINLGALWRRCSDAASVAKRSKYRSLIATDSFFDIQCIRGDEALCKVTGRTLSEEEIHYGKPENDNGESITMGEDVKAQIDLGKKLAKANYLVESIDSDRQNAFHPVDLSTGFSTYDTLTNRGALEQYLVRRYNRTDIAGDAHSFLFYGGNISPLKENGEKRSFEDICVDEKDKPTKLGVLKMDVDNLGKIFIEGLKAEDRSFSAYATLSMLLELFFSGYINDIRDSETYKDHVQIIYSGGDDVFAVGRWDKVIEFAAEVNQRFHDFTGRDDITLSAGIAIVRQKYPISRAADLADEAEHASKSYPHDQVDDSKNAITFFGETVSWSEFGQVKEMQDTFHKMINEGAVSTGFLHRLQAYKLQKDDNAQKAKAGHSKDYSYKWHSAYTVARMIEPLKKDKERHQATIDFLLELQKGIMHHEMGSDRYLDLIGLAARWTEYLNKLSPTKSENHARK